MARKTFLITYPDRSKKHVDAFERDQMLLAGELRAIDNSRYEWVGEVKTYHSFADLQGLRDTLERSPALLRRFLPGAFIVEYPRRLGGKRVRELLQTPEAMALGLGGFEAAA